MEGVGTNGADILIAKVGIAIFIAILAGYTVYAIRRLTQPSCTIYLSGAITGVEDFRSTFDHYAKLYRRRGYRVISPVELDRWRSTTSYRELMRKDINIMLRKADRIYMLPGWASSNGATLERIVAEMTNIPVYDAVTGEPF